MATKKAAKKVAGKAKARDGQCARAEALILQGKSNQQVWDVIHREFPKSRLGVSGAGWIRNKLRHEKGGSKIKTNRELNAARTPAKKKAA